jgi:hypothetical protein
MAIFTASPSRAEEPQLDISPETLEARPPPAPATDSATEGPPERPRRPGIVLGSTLGVLGFAGNFRHVAPPAYWLHGQLGYEVTRGVLLYVGGDLAWTDTSESQAEANALAVVMWGFGGGVRGTVYFNERIAGYAEAEVGALTADVKHDELTVLGFRNAENVNPAAGGRLGIEWYQMDRHLALYVAGGARYAEGFARVVGPSDFPLVWDAGLGVRYTF